MDADFCKPCHITVMDKQLFVHS